MYKKRACVYQRGTMYEKKEHAYMGKTHARNGSKGIYLPIFDTRAIKCFCLIENSLFILCV